MRRPWRTLLQELLQRPWRNAACWLILHGSWSLLSSAAQSHQHKGGTVLRGQSHSHQTLFKEMSHKIDLWVKLMRAFPNRGSLFAGGSGLCQANENESAHWPSCLHPESRMLLNLSKKPLSSEGLQFLTPVSAFLLSLLAVKAMDPPYLLITVHHQRPLGQELK